MDKRKDGEKTFEVLKKRLEKDIPMKRQMMKMALALDTVIRFKENPLLPELRNQPPGEKYYDKNDCWDKTTKNQIVKFIEERGDINEEVLKSMAEKMKVSGAFQSNINKSSPDVIRHTFLEMMRKWWQQEIFAKDTLEGQNLFINVLKDSMCPKQVIFAVRKTFFSYIDKITGEDHCDDIEDVLKQLKPSLEKLKIEELNKVLTDAGLDDLEIEIQEIIEEGERQQTPVEGDEKDSGKIREKVYKLYYDGDPNGEGIKKLIEREKSSWKRDHKLIIKEKRSNEMKKDIEKFTGKLKMCSHSVNRYGFDERIWMIANEDENWAVSFREEEEREGEFIVKIHKIDTNKTKFDVKETFESDEEIRRRIENVLGATNYSVLLRNSEHIAWYIFTNIWASFQVGQEISILKEILQPPKDVEKFINEIPEDFRKKDSSEDPMFPTLDIEGGFILNPQNGVLQEKVTNKLRILFLGPIGVGKSTIINHLYNRDICPVGENSARRTTNRVHPSHGIFIDKNCKNCKNNATRINFFDTIGLCDGELTDSENVDFVKTALKRYDLQDLDKVVVVVDVHNADNTKEEALQNWLYALKYHEHKNRFVFILSQCDRYKMKEEDKKDSLDKQLTRITNSNMPESDSKIYISDFDKYEDNENIREQIRNVFIDRFLEACKIHCLIALSLDSSHIVNKSIKQNIL